MFIHIHTFIFFFNCSKQVRRYSPLLSSVVCKGHNIFDPDGLKFLTILEISEKL